MVSEMTQMRVFDIQQVEVNLTIHEIAKIMDDVAGYSAAYFYDPDLSTHLLALGEAAACILSGDERFQVAKQFIRHLAARKNSESRIPFRVFGGFSFVTALQANSSAWAGWPDGKLFLPKVLIECKKEANHATITFFQIQEEPTREFPQGDISPEALQEWIQRTCRETGSDDRASELTADVRSDFTDGTGNDKGHWIRLVQQGSEAVSAGKLKKVVLARAVTEPAHRPISGIIHHLNDQYPFNFTFAFWHLGACFLGSSPERLCSVAEGILNVDCLAGSEARGKSAEADAALGARLLASSKNLAEHQAVVDRVTEDVSHLVGNLQVANVPVLKKLTNVQHLYTPVQGTVRDGIGIFDVVETLHPTPAVAGVPSLEALRFIAENEQIDRGWYAGPVGYVDVCGNGKFAVALRSGLVRGQHATLFAGAGIMADSVPEAEWEETELKFMPMRSAIGNREEGTESESTQGVN
jgi:isochorismate synthase